MGRDPAKRFEFIQARASAVDEMVVKPLEIEVTAASRGERTPRMLHLLWHRD